MKKLLLFIFVFVNLINFANAQSHIKFYFEINNPSSNSSDIIMAKVKKANTNGVIPAPNTNGWFEFKLSDATDNQVDFGTLPDNTDPIIILIKIKRDDSQDADDNKPRGTHARTLESNVVKLIISRDDYINNNNVKPILIDASEDTYIISRSGDRSIQSSGRTIVIGSGFPMENETKMINSNSTPKGKSKVGIKK